MARRYTMQAVDSVTSAKIYWVSRAKPDFDGTQRLRDNSTANAIVSGSAKVIAINDDGIREHGLTVDLVQDLGYQPAKTFAEYNSNTRKYDVCPYFNDAKDIILAARASGASFGFVPSGKIKFPTAYMYQDGPLEWEANGLRLEGDGPLNSILVAGHFGPQIHFRGQAGLTFSWGPSILTGTTRSWRIDPATSKVHYLSLTENGGFIPNGRQTYTIEFFLQYHTDVDATAFLMAIRGGIYSGQATDSLLIYQPAGNPRKLIFRQRVGDAGTAQVLHPTTMVVGQTYHVVCQFYNGNTVNIAIDGVWGTPSSVGAAATGAKTYDYENFTIGAALPTYPDTGTPGTGIKAYISSVRFSNTARYNTAANFTPPSSAHTWDGSTGLLIDFEDAPANAWGFGASGGYGVIGNYIKCRTATRAVWLYDKVNDGGNVDGNGASGLYLRGNLVNDVTGSVCLIANACSHSQWHDMQLGPSNFGIIVTEGCWNSNWYDMKFGSIGRVGICFLNATTLWTFSNAFMAGKYLVIADGQGTLNNICGDSPAYQIAFVLRTGQYDTGYQLNNCGIGSEQGPAPGSFDSFLVVQGNSSFTTQVQLNECAFGTVENFTGPIIRMVNPGTPTTSKFFKVSINNCNHVGGGLGYVLGYQGTMPIDGQICVELDNFAMRGTIPLPPWTNGNADQIGHTRIRGGRSSHMTPESEFVYRGVEQFSAATTTSAVAFPALADATYNVRCNIVSESASSASRSVRVKNRTTTGFDLVVDVAPGGAETCDVYWEIVDYSEVV